MSAIININFFDGQGEIQTFVLPLSLGNRLFFEMKKRVLDILQVDDQRMFWNDGINMCSLNSPSDVEAAVDYAQIVAKNQKEDPFIDLHFSPEDPVNAWKFSAIEEQLVNQDLDLWAEQTEREKSLKKWEKRLSEREAKLNETREEMKSTVAEAIKEEMRAITAGLMEKMEAMEKELGEARELVVLFGEKHLISAVDIPISRRFVIAEKYGMKDLKEHLLSQITSVEQVKTLESSKGYFSTLPEETKDSMFKQLLERAKEHEQKLKNIAPIPSTGLLGSGLFGAPPSYSEGLFGNHRMTAIGGMAPGNPHPTAVGGMAPASHMTPVRGMAPGSHMSPVYGMPIGLFPNGQGGLFGAPTTTVAAPAPAALSRPQEQIEENAPVMREPIVDAKASTLQSPASEDEEEPVVFSDKNIDYVMGRAGVSKDDAIRALTAADGESHLAERVAFKEKLERIEKRLAAMPRKTTKSVKFTRDSTESGSIGEALLKTASKAGKDAAAILSKLGVDVGKKGDEKQEEIDGMIAAERLSREVARDL